MNTKRLLNFILERHRIHIRRAEHSNTKPWTKDPILQAYRFCNVYRELDRVTVWIHEHWREPNRTDPMLWFAMVIARLLNTPASLEALGYPRRWNEDRFIRILQGRMDKGERVFNGAYMIGTGGSDLPKVEYLATTVLTPMWLIRKRMTAAFQGNTLQQAYEALVQYHGIADFLAGQIIADVKNTMGQPLHWADDWMSWAVLGPGSRRGLNRVLGRGVKRRGLSKEKAHKYLLAIQYDINRMMGRHGYAKLCLQDTQNCLCEFDKYERARRGQGRPKQLFDGK